MQPAVSTMGTSTHSCWSLVEWITMTRHCEMHGCWMWTQEHGRRYVCKFTVQFQAFIVCVICILLLHGLYCQLGDVDQRVLSNHKLMLC